MAMIPNPVYQSARIFDGINIPLTNDVRAALSHLVRTAIPLEDRKETMRLDTEPVNNPFEQVLWLLEYCDITKALFANCGVLLLIAIVWRI